ncbi:MAG: FKBP-type peptidyl-prolyl cis-trans isomerase [Planctomyces sp.]
MRLLFSVVLIAAVAGCESGGRGVGEGASQELSREGSAPVTFLDRESLRSGVGPVDKDVSSEFSETASGLKYRILRQSDGRRPTASNTVEVHYRGWLDSGRQCDSSYDRGETASWGGGLVVAGGAVGVGGMIELWIPSELGYGSRGSPGSIPPNATLHFVIELIKVQ